MGTDNLDELEPRNGNLPPALHPDATREEMVAAVNGLAVELQLIRLAFQEQGSHIELGFKRIEAALNAFRSRPTDPPPKGE